MGIKYKSGVVIRWYLRSNPNFLSYKFANDNPFSPTCSKIRGESRSNGYMRRAIIENDHRENLIYVHIIVRGTAPMYCACGYRVLLASEINRVYLVCGLRSRCEYMIATTNLRENIERSWATGNGILDILSASCSMR